MNRTEKEEYVIGCISLLSNKLAKFGDTILPDITYKQWFLLLMIAKMEKKEKNINAIAEFVGTTRQNVKKMLVPLEKKGYIVAHKSTNDGRSVTIALTEKTYQYFSDNDVPTAQHTNDLFSTFSEQEIDSFILNLQKLTNCLTSKEQSPANKCQ